MLGGVAKVFEKTKARGERSNKSVMDWDRLSSLCNVVVTLHVLFSAG